MKKAIKTILLIGVIGVSVYFIYYLVTKQGADPIVYQTISTTDTTIIKKTVATGSVIPRREINMKSQVSGIIEKLYFIAGSQIKVGDVIARVKIIPDLVNLNNAETRVSQAQINFDNAKIEIERNKELFKQNVIPKTEMIASEQKFNTNKTELEAAETNLQLIKDGVNKKAGQSTTNTLIRSTITGMILDVPVKEGTRVIESNTFNEGTTIASVADMGEMIFEGKLDESEVGKIHEGMELNLSIGALENVKLLAKLEYISPKGVTENGAIQFQIRAAIDFSKNPGGAFLRAGYSANADIILEKRDKVMSVPESVLIFENGNTFVEVQTGPGKFEKRKVKTGISDGIIIEVLEGLQKTDRIKVPQLQMGQRQNG
ncbi:MAG: efflux RND transporter periplasmic adaptor subunit [Bacteroidia bacterium]|nr:efflux RND transporter periplasmic adaptor subunit [Bacteroidia bacterium]